jgi:hypothetical protein
MSDGDDYCERGKNAVVERTDKRPMAGLDCRVELKLELPAQPPPRITAALAPPTPL